MCRTLYARLIRPNDTVPVLILIVQRPLHSLLSIDSVCEWFPAFDALAVAIGSGIISDGGDGDVVLLSKPLLFSMSLTSNHCARVVKEGGRPDFARL